MARPGATSYRLSDEAHAIISRMVKRLGLPSRAAVIEAALRHFASWVDAGWTPPKEDLELAKADRESDREGPETHGDEA